MALTVEKASREEYKSGVWFKYRAGRITASKMKAVCHTNPANPSQTLIKQVCYPQSYAFTSRQTCWGCMHEKAARDCYEKRMKESHTNFSVTDSGFIINPQWPFIGATPDGIVSCTCCGEGVMEIKCPYCHKGQSIEVSIQDTKFCIQKNVNGVLELDHSHSYYYQVQTQLFVCSAKYCDFCVCTFSEDQEHDFYQERLSQNTEFWENCVTKSKHFFQTSILPELIAKWYTKSDKIYGVSFDMDVDTNDQEGSLESTKVDIITYCYCKGPDEGNMIGCENPECLIEWFHWDCLKIKSAPKGRWYCPDCRKLPQFIRRKTKTKRQS